MLPLPTIAGLLGPGQNRLAEAAKQGAVGDELAPRATDSACCVVERLEFGHLWLPGPGRDRDRARS